MSNLSQNTLLILSESSQTTQSADHLYMLHLINY